MKDTTGELSMTVIVLIGAIALAGIVTFLMPTIKEYINSTWAEMNQCDMGETWDANQKKCVPV